MTLTIGSLFSGIGGLELGLERAGLGPVKWQAESDPYCLKVLAKHWPDVRRYPDVRDIDDGAERVDLICGGFPCQDLSYAGKGAGIDGARSGLWSEFIRVVRCLRPRFVLVENVPALLARGMGRVLGDLSQSGYDAGWDCIPAAAVGAPHRRDRTFIVAYDADHGWEDDSRDEPGERLEAGGKAAQKRNIIGRQFTATGLGCSVPKRATFRIKPTAIGLAQWDTEPDLGRVVHGVSYPSHRLIALGNAVVPQVAEYIGRMIAEAL